MAAFAPDKIRNVALVGHSGCGKTSLAEALLFKAGVTNRLGSVQDGSSILDTSEDSKEKKSSLDSALCYLSHKDLKINIIDTPGTQAFIGYAIAPLAAVETAAVVISAPSGIEVNTRKMVEIAREHGLGTWIIINHIDAPNLDLPALVAQIQETFGDQCVPLNLPTGGGSGVIDCLANESGDADFSSVEDAHTAAIEAIVGADDDLMEKYLGGELSADEAKAAAAGAVAAGVFTPILFTNSRGDVGISEVLQALEICCPSPTTGMKRTFVVGDGDDKTETEIEPSASGDFIGQVFKVTTDPKSNIKYLGIRVHTGKLTSDMTVKTLDDPKGTRPGHVMLALGSDHKETDAATAGDIICLAKLDYGIGDVVCTKTPGAIAMPKFPMPMFQKALVSKSRGDEDKIGVALKRFAEEDPCFTQDRSSGEMVISGMGDMQVQTYLARMTKQYKLEVDMKPPRIPYRETITGRAENIEYTHKKQSGGAGQFGRVIINVLPAERGEGYEFVDKIFGGSIDQAFRPSVDKGVRAQMVEGVLAGFPVVDVKVELIDGKTHPVDSKDIAFQIAGRGAFKDGFMKAKPVLLEPIVKIEVTVPAEFVGDVQGDLASRRGRPSGQEMLPGNMAVIRAIVPLAEVADYNSRLSSISGGQGSYMMEASHYENVPGNVQQQIIDARKKELEEGDS